jgi:hypothetical protein
MIAIPPKLHASFQKTSPHRRGYTKTPEQQLPAQLAPPRRRRGFTKTPEPQLPAQLAPPRRRRGFTETPEPQLPARRAPRILAQSAVIAGVSGALSVIPFSSVLQSILLMVLLSAGVGSAVMCWLDLPSGAAVAGVIGLSLAAVIAFATSMAWLGIWYPVPSCVILSFLVASVGLIRLWTLREVGGRPEPMSVIVAADSRDNDATARLSARPPLLAHIAGHASPYIAAVLLYYAFVIWLPALPLLRNDPGGQYGLLATRGGVLLLAATILSITGFFVALVMRRMVTAALAILVVIFFQRVTVTLITEVPNYTWTYKHVAVADYIIENGALPSLPFDIYSPWPGFFAGMAWFSSITGLDLIDAAHWFAPVADTLTTVMVGALALGFGLTVRAAFMAAMVAQLLNWVGQDYFSPQAIGLILATAVLALLAYSKRSPAAGYVSLPIFTVLVSVHQLTPVWICTAAVALALFGLMRPRWLAVLYCLILAVYLMPRRSNIEQHGWFTGFNPLANSEPAVSNRGSDGRVFTTLVEQGLALSMWLLAAICFIVTWRGIAARWAVAMMAYSSALLLFGQDYGGEAIFRVYLYSIPGCVVLLAAFLVRPLSLKRRGHLLLGIVAAWLVVIGFAVAGMQGYYGSWSYVTITRSQLEQSRWLSATNRAGTLMTVPAPAGWPIRASADYARYAVVNPWYDIEPDALKDSLQTGWPTLDNLDQMESYAKFSGRRLYILLPRQAWAYGEYMGYFKPGALQTFVEQLYHRSGWTKVINDADTLAFVYVPVGR